MENFPCKNNVRKYDATNATIEIIYGNNLGPTGSEKKGVSS